MIDFGLLLQSSIKTLDPDTQEETFIPAIKLMKSQHDAKSMEIQVYRVNLAKAKEQIENNGRVLRGARESFLDPSQEKCEMNPEAQTQLQLTFEDESTMQRARQLMETFIESFEERNDSRAGAVPGPHQSKLQIYNWLLTSQVEFWKFNSISEE